MPPLLEGKMSAPFSSGRILCNISEIRLDRILVSGQSFRWKEEKPGLWTGVLYDRIWKLWQSETAIFYQIFGNDKTQSESDKTQSESASDLVKASGAVKTAELRPKVVKDSESKEKTLANSLSEELRTSENIYEDLIKDYFQLNVNIAALYKKWSEVDSNFQLISAKFEGIRLLRQDPVENLFSFICSSNNHISRISSMIEKLCENYGRGVGHLEGKTYYSFPTISEMSDEGVESELRNLGFGYRAKYINRSARQILDKGGETWLRSLRGRPYEEAKKELMTLNGVGAKVADCVCLMSLDKTEAVPVDTHVWQIAARGYMPRLSKCKSLTDRLYNEIGDHFRTLWGPYAGWAQAVLFTADLKQFKEKELSPVKNKAEKSETGTKSETSAKKRKVTTSKSEGNSEEYCQGKATTARKRKQERQSSGKSHHS